MTDSRFHNIREMRMKPENWTVNGHHNIFIIHLFQKCRDPGAYHKAGTAWNAFANIPNCRAIGVRWIRDFQIGQSLPATSVIADGIRFDFGDIFRVESGMKYQNIDTGCVIWFWSQGNRLNALFIPLSLLKTMQCTVVELFREGVTKLFRWI